MRTKRVLGIGVLCAAIALLLSVAGVVWAAAGDGFLGTWKLNEAKSKMAAGLAKNSTVVYTADGDKVKVTIDGTDDKGQAFHSEWTGKYDGKDYAVTGDPSSDMRAYKLEGTRTLVATTKKDGKAGVTARIVLSADGKTRTVTVSGTDASGKKVTATQVYDKQ
jgi:hypothetical protein